MSFLLRIVLIYIKIIDKADLDIYSIYIGKISAFVDFASTKWDGFEQNFEYYIKDVISKSLNFKITKIEPDTITFEIEDQEVVCYIDDEYLIIEWQDKKDE